MADKKSLFLLFGVVFAILIIFELIAPRPPLKEYYCPNQKIGYTMCPNESYSNSLGYHDNEFSTHPDVFFIGDSFVMDIAQPINSTISHLFEEKTCRKSLNLGISGYSASQYALTFDNFSYLNPEYAFVFFTPSNDLTELNPNLTTLISLYKTYPLHISNQTIDTYSVNKSPFLITTLKIIKKSNLLYFLYNKYLHIKNLFVIPGEYYSYMVPIRPEIIEQMSNTEKLYDHLLYQADKNGIKVIFVIIMPKEKAQTDIWNKGVSESPRLKDYKFDLDIPRNWMINYAKSRNVTYIDLNDELWDEKSKIYIPNDGHYNDYGINMTAEILKNKVGSKC